MLSSAYEYVNVRDCFIDLFNFKEEMIGLVTAGKQKDVINTVRTLRSNNDDTYKKVKLDLMVITPFGSFRERKKEELISLSGFMYLDIDGKDNLGIKDFEQTKKEIFQQHGDKIFMICLSSSGKGLSIFIKIDRPYTRDEFCSVYSYVKGLIPGYTFDKGIGTDGDIARAWFVSYDPNLLFNYDAYVTVPLDIPHVIPISNKEDREHLTLKRTLFNWDEILANNVLKTKHVMLNPVIDVIPEEHILIWWKKCITRGSRKKTLRGMGYKFLRLNPATGRDHIYAFFHNINEDYIRPKLTQKEIETTALKTIETYTEDMFIPFIIKTKHFNQDKLFPKQKSKFSNELSGMIRKNKTITKIIAKCNELTASGLKVNQSIVSRETGIRRGTVNRYWGSAPIDEEIKQMVDWINITYADRNVIYRSKTLDLDHAQTEVQDKCNKNRKHLTVKRTLSDATITCLREVCGINIHELLSKLIFNKQRAAKTKITKEKNRRKKIEEMKERLPGVLAMLKEKFGIDITNTLKYAAMKASEDHIRLKQVTQDAAMMKDADRGVLDIQILVENKNEGISLPQYPEVVNKLQNEQLKALSPQQLPKIIYQYPADQNIYTSPLTSEQKQNEPHKIDQEENERKYTTDKLLELKIANDMPVINDAPTKLQHLKSKMILSNL